MVHSLDIYSNFLIIYFWNRFKILYLKTRERLQCSENLLFKIRFYNRFSSAGNGKFYFLSSRMHVARSQAHSCIWFYSNKSYKKRMEGAIIEKRNVLKRMHRAAKEERERLVGGERVYRDVESSEAAATDCAKRACRDYRRLFCRRWR